MTADEIRAAIAADPALQTLAADGNHIAIATALSAGRMKPTPRMTSARGLAELLPGGALQAEAILLKLEAARDAMLASTNDGERLMGSVLRRQLGFLASDGLDFGSAALRGTLDQLGAAAILTGAEVDAFKAIALVPDTIAHVDVAVALEAAQ